MMKKFLGTYSPPDIPQTIFQLTPEYFRINGDEVTVNGFSQLKDNSGKLSNDGMAFFFGSKSLYVANTKTGRIRMFSSDGFLLVDDEDIDYNTIEAECRHGIHNARRKEICYSGLNRWDGFKEGLCAITWMLYPDGRYFADSDGFGMEDNDEEEVYAIINTDLEIVEPFRPIEDVKAYLDELREKKREGKTNRL